ncbi:MAG: dihydropteroate synthase [Actinobacteria bacterium]|nr:dihydropteroate synthase [Actinomycetota bacterium]
MGYRIRKLDIKTKKQGLDEFAKIGSTAAGQVIMVNKIFPLALKVKGLNPRGADILKQEMLARNGDVVTSRDNLIQLEGLVDVIILGTEKSMKSLADKIKVQPFGLKKLSTEIIEYIDFLNKGQATSIYKAGKKIIDIKKESPLIMGILNVTDDSFYDGGKYFNEKDIRQRIDAIISEGAGIIDIGGMSTRPGSKPVSIEIELSRVLPPIKYAREAIDARLKDNNFYKNNILISCDTYRHEVAIEAVANGADIINDISGLTFDDNMAAAVSDLGAGLIIMHIKGTPENMQENPVYENLIDEIYDFLYLQADYAKQAGINSQSIIIDPGIGFGKTLEHNLYIIQRLKDFRNMGYPVLAGASRKSFIGALLGKEKGKPAPAGQRLEGSIAAAVYSFINGANILRVHDVAQTVNALKIAAAIKNI